MIVGNTKNHAKPLEDVLEIVATWAGLDVMIDDVPDDDLLVMIRKF